MLDGRMLTELHIENLGVIERVDLILGAGLTAVTGETGAGKTMLVEAIELLVGGRADATIVRPGADEARVDGRFVTADGEELVLSRVIPRDGRSRAYVERAPGDRGDARRGDRRPGRPPRPARPPEPAVDRARSGPPSTGSVESTSTPLRAARARLTEIDAELAALGGDERSAPARSTCCASRSTSSTRPTSIDADEDARWTPRRRCSATRSATAKRAEQATAALRRRRRRARRARRRRSARSTAARRSRDQPRGCTHCSSEVDDVVAELRDRGERSRRTRTPRGDPRASAAA